MNKNPKSLKKYVVLVVSLKRRSLKLKRKTNPDFPNLHVLVRKNEQLQKALKAPTKGKTLKELNLKTRFRGIVKSENILYFENKVDAYKGAYKRLESLLTEGRKACIHGEVIQNNYSVYCIKLNPSVWNDGKFKKMNPHIRSAGTNGSSCSQNAYYVGQTQQEIKKRYLQHISLDKKELKSTKWGRNYFIKHFDEAFDLELMQAFEKETGKSSTNLPYGRSIIIEHDLTDWIREKGMGAYCA